MKNFKNFKNKKSKICGLKTYFVLRIPTTKARANANILGLKS